MACVLHSALLTNYQKLANQTDLGCLCRLAGLERRLQAGRHLAAQARGGERSVLVRFVRQLAYKVPVSTAGWLCLGAAHGRATGSPPKVLPQRLQLGGQVLQNQQGRQPELLHHLHTCNEEAPMGGAGS